MSRRSSLVEYTVAELRATTGLTFERVFVSDTFQRGIYELDLADTTTADNLGLVLVTADNKRYKRVLESPVVSAEWFKTASNTNVTANLNIALQLSTVQKVVVYKDTTISGTLTVPTDKVLSFDTKGKFIGTATISGGIVEAPYENQIFDVNITANLQGASNGIFSGRWFGALPSASAATNTAALQKAIDTCIANLIPNIYIPKGTYSINKGLLLYAGVTTHVSLRIYGDLKGQSIDGTRETVINCTHADNFGIAIHLGKGVTIESLTIRGVNQLQYTKTQAYSAASTYLTGSSRDNRYSPYAGIVFEPFHQSVTGGDRYPGFESYYASISGTGGSTNCVVKDVTIDGFTVARVLGPNGATQNNESHVFERNWISNCREGFASCQSQERTVAIKNENIWNSVKTCYHTGVYGAQFGCPPKIDGLNVAGNIFEIFNYSHTGYNSLFVANNLFAEDFYRIGKISGQAKISNSQFHLVDPSLISDSYGIQSWIIDLGDLGFLEMDNSQLFHFNDKANFPLRFKGTSGRKHIASFKNCKIAYPTHFQNDGSVFDEADLDNLFELYNSVIYNSDGQYSKILDTSRLTYAFDYTEFFNYDQIVRSGNEIVYGMGSYLGDTNRIYIKHKVTSAALRFTNPTGAITVTKSGNEATFDLDDAPAANLKNVLRVGDMLFTTASITDQFGFASGGHIGRVKEINGSNVVTIEGLIDGFITGSYAFYTAYFQHLNRPFIGDVTSGSPDITNVGSAPNWNAGDRLDVPGFNKGVYITGVSGSTVTMSKNAVGSINNVVCSRYDYDEEGVTWGDPITAFASYLANVTIRRGTRLKDINPDSNVLEWLCTKSGMFGTINPPVFEAIYKLNEIRFSKTFDGTTGDGEVGALTIDSYTIPTGYFIEETLVDVGAGLTGGGYITLGIATDDIDAALDSTSGLVTTLNSNIVSKVSGSLLKAAASRALVAAVGGSDITAGTANFIIRLKKF